MDVEFWKEVVGLGANIVLLGTAIAAAVGVTRWSKEHKGRKRIDLAEDVLASAYEAREAIKYIRNPLTMAGEYKALAQDAGESAVAFRRRQIYSVAHFRRRELADVFNRLRTLCFQVEATFGKSFGLPVRTILMIPQEVEAAGASLARFDVDAYVSEEQRLRNLDFQRSLEATYWSDTGQEDPMVAKLEDALSALETFAAHVVTNDGEPPEQLGFPKSPKESP